uniref:Alcohol dehydrogenase [NADP(+)] n=1 Tax=Cacopsylla melanoneura TaxID=428564 RepID=A0A8D8U9F4_9HEMI
MKNPLLVLLVLAVACFPTILTLPTESAGSVTTTSTNPVTTTSTNTVTTTSADSVTTDNVTETTTVTLADTTEPIAATNFVTDLHSVIKLRTRLFDPTKISATTEMKYIQLPNDAGLMPVVGYGTWQAKDEDLEKALEAALEAGYRHIDTATVYENEHVIGNVLDRWMKAGKVKREELFIVTKLPPSGNRPSNVESFIKKSLEKLKVDYLDLYLVHTPFSFAEGPEVHPVNEDGTFKLDLTTDHIAVWKEMEKQVDAGRTKAIGLSNFNKTQISRVLKEARIPPANLQVELHVYFQQKELQAFCKEHNITMVAYSPLGSQGTGKLFGIDIPNLMENPVVKKIAEKHSRKPAQVLLKFIVQNDIAVIPKSTNPERLKQNINILDFQLSDEDMTELTALDQGKEGRILDFSFIKGVKDHPEFPF